MLLRRRVESGVVDQTQGHALRLLGVAGDRYGDAARSVRRDTLHSSVLFATLAGFSLMLLAGRRQPRTGLTGRRARARIAIRAVILLALGTVMAMEYGGVIILGFYGVYFLLALPLVRLSARTLAIIAAAFALVTPQCCSP